MLGNKMANDYLCDGTETAAARKFDGPIDANLSIKHAARLINLSKTYRHARALNQVSIDIEKGKIYGFIGQNGAGKTTLMRIIAGLAFPTEGTVELFGKSGQKNLEAARKRIGCMIEQVSMCPELTASQNLELQRILKGVSDENTVDHALKMVGLLQQGNKKFKDFSLGMKQRLGIAAALLGDPELLILDEPVNGLDPVGILEVRDLLSKLNREHGVTILISSHILSELYMLATDYIIIHQGQIVDRLTLEELSSRCKKHITIQSEHVERVKRVMIDQLGIMDFIVLEDNKVQLTDCTIDRNAFARAFHENDIVLTELSYADESLEDYFVHAIGGKKK